MPRTSQEIIDREFLEIRAKILELAASFDRIERADGSADERLEKVARGLEILGDSASGKAKRIQVLFSREYSDSWRSDFGIQ